MRRGKSQSEVPEAWPGLWWEGRQGLACNWKDSLELVSRCTMLEQPGIGWRAENKARPFVGVLPLEPGSMMEPVELG